uniref:C1q domain-containing protein n=1 Tax=Daphnia galeata TaxID=27404 RepID=A0A8J2WK76_9CRUS|nr:unnamed protein product [Daphnia galeata]
MVAIPIKFVVVIVLAVACCHCQSEKIGSDSSTWEKLQISADTFSSVEYANFLVEIYEHTDNNKASTTMSQKKYFYSPLTILDHKSAVSSYNRFTKQPEMRFRIEMWNDKVQNEVVKHLKKIVGQEIQSDNVKVFPMKKIILISDVPTEEYSISSRWSNYDSKSKSIWFSLSCYDPKTSQTKQATISIDSVTSGSMVSHLLQKFEDKNEIFLTPNDEKKMLTETATNIRMETFDDSEIASPDTENQIVNILKDLLITSRTTIKEQNDKMWDSVFWNDENYRPDKTTKTLNEILNKLDKETQQKLANLFQKAESQSGIQLTWMKGKMKKESNTIMTQTVGRKNHVQFDGEKFVPKPIQLGRINLDKFRDSQSFQNRNVRVRYTINVELSVPIKFMEHTELTVTDEWNNLKEQLKATVELLNTTSGELSSVKLDLAAAVMKLGEMNNEWTNKFKTTSELLNTTVKNLVKTNDELSRVKRDLTHTTNALKATSIRLDHERKVNEENLRNELRVISIRLETTISNLNTTRTELINVKSDFKTILNDRTSEIVDIGKMPTSCFDLERMGHKLSGFFSVKGSKKMEMIFCDFNPNQNDKQKWIGYNDVKSAPVHFYVQRNRQFSTYQTPIPFDLAVVNEGNAMNLTSGIFTAPRPGIYFFSFTGLAYFPASSSRVALGVSLYLNGGQIGTGWVEESNNVAGQQSPLTLQSTMNLKSGDQVWVAINWQATGAYLGDNSAYHWTHFTGWMLEEEIVASF